MRFGFALVALEALALLAGTAHAQILDQPATLGREDFLIRLRRRDNDEWTFLNATEAKFFFNRARCECEEPVQIVLELSNSGYAKRQLISTGEVRLLVGGTECLADTASARMGAMCEQIGGSIRLADLAIRRREIDTTVARLFERRGEGATGEGCAAEFTQTLWVWLDADMNGTPDLLGASAPSLGLELDGKPPPAPGEVEVTSGNEALQVKWAGLSGIADFGGYVVFCARGGEYPVFADSGYSDQYFVCPRAGVSPGAGVPPAAGRPGTGTPVLAPTAFRALDPEFLCSDLLTSQTETRLSILQNGIPYVVGVAAVDRRGNASPIDVAVLQSPVPTRDFYRGYRAAGGQADGGCAFGGGGAAGPLALAAALAALAQARRTRRGGRS